MLAAGPRLESTQDSEGRGASAVSVGGEDRAGGGEATVVARAP